MKQPAADTPTDAKLPMTNRMSPFFEARCGLFHSRSRLPMLLRLLTGLWLLLGLIPLGLGSTIVANGHYLELDGQPFLYLSDTEWLLNKYSEPDIKEILDARAAQGFTVIKIGAVELNMGNTPPYTYCRTDFNGNPPFGLKQMNHCQRPSPSDCTDFNDDWWDRLVDIVDWANERELWIELTIGGPGRRDGNPYEINTQPYAETAYEYGQLVGQKFRGKPNIIFNIGADTGADTYNVSPPNPRGIGQTAWEEMARGVADGYNNVNDPMDTGDPTDYNTTTQTFHPGWPDVNDPTHLSSSFWFHEKEWEDFDAMQVSDLAQVYNRVAYDYNFPFGNPPVIKPTVFIEGGYEAYDSFWTPQKIRLQAWHAMFAGAAGYTYGHWENAEPQHDDPPIHPEPVDYVNADGANQIIHLKNFMDDYHWWRFVPDQGVIASNEGDSTNRLVAAKDSDGYECYVYYPQDTPSAEINLNSVNGNGLLDHYYVEAKWFNPQNGDEVIVPSGPFYYDSTHLTQTFNMPISTPSWEDGVLILKALPSAVSRKTHGGAGAFDVPLPLGGTAGIECRQGGGTNADTHQMIITFPTPVTVTGNPQAAVTSGTGTVSGISGGNNTSEVTVDLTGVTNAQTITVTLYQVDDGTPLHDVSVPMSVLLGDASGNGSVNNTDVSQVKLQSGMTVPSANFRNDLNPNGTINGTDVAIAKLKSGTSLP